jgi:transposase InsO family protein
VKNFSEIELTDDPAYGRQPTRSRQGNYGCLVQHQTYPGWGAAFTGVLASNGITITMDGKGAGHDNVFVERLWRSVKYEEVYLRTYESVSDARASLGRYLVTAADHIRALTA